MIELRVVAWADERFREQLMAVRYEVFVGEQSVPSELEEDGLDPEARHVLLTVEGVPSGTARWRTLPDGLAKVERVAVRSGLRGQGWGARIMDVVEADVRLAGSARIVLAAQLSAAAFYEARGYLPVGEPFLEAGIEHVRMERDAAAFVC